VLVVIIVRLDLDYFLNSVDVARITLDMRNLPYRVGCYAGLRDLVRVRTMSVVVPILHVNNKPY
jgi:hypothetical protein